MVYCLEEGIMERNHKSIFYIYLVSTKMYHVLEEVYWYNSKKKVLQNLFLSAQIAKKLN